MGENQLPIDPEDVAVAADRIAGVAKRTPVFTSRSLDERLGATVYLKAESFQRGGAFKFRGAYNTVASLSPQELARGWSPRPLAITRRRSR
jgi:threo-3-hydroxy-L-aspartate ammonia-lyase